MKFLMFGVEHWRTHLIRSPKTMRLIDCENDNRSMKIQLHNTIGALNNQTFRNIHLKTDKADKSKKKKNKIAFTRFHNVFLNGDRVISKRG